MIADAPRWIHVGAVVVRNGSALFVRQTATHSLGPVWTIPWGVLQSGEPPSAGALRETVEEAAVTATVEGLLAVQCLPAPWEGTLAFVYLCAHQDGEPRPDGIETDAARYLSLDELRNSTEMFEPWCRWLAIQTLEGRTGVLQPVAGNPFGAEGFIARDESKLERAWAPQRIPGAASRVLALGLDPAFVDPAQMGGFTPELVRTFIDSQLHRVRNAGYDVVSCLVDAGQTAEAVTRGQLCTGRFDCVLIGAGLREETRLPLFEQLLNVVHELAPGARICFNSTPADSLEAVQRCLDPQGRST